MIKIRKLLSVREESRLNLLPRRRRLSDTMGRLVDTSIRSNPPKESLDGWNTKSFSTKRPLYKYLESAVCFLVAMRTGVSV